nr:uncharacterized protein LOC110360371 [Columba livia]
MWRGGAKAWRSPSNGGVCGRSWMGCFTVYSVTVPGGMSHRTPATAPAALRARPGPGGTELKGPWGWQCTVRGGSVAPLCSADVTAVKEKTCSRYLITGSHWDNSCFCATELKNARRWLSARCPQHTAGSSAAQTVSSRCPLTPRPRARCPPRATWAARGAPSKPLSSSLCMSVWHPSSSFTPIVDLVKGFRSAPFISLVIAVNVDKSLPACLLLEYDFYFVFCVYLGQKVGCILTLGECVCLCLSHCVFLSHPSTQTCISLHVCIRHACTHTDIPMQTCVCTAAHAQLRHTPHAHTPNLQ